MRLHRKSDFFCFALLLSAAALHAQAPPAAPAGPGRGPVVVSPEVLPDKRVTVRLYAPQAKKVSVSGLVTPAADLKKGANDVWEGTVGPMESGAYRYRFSV